MRSSAISALAASLLAALPAPARAAGSAGATPFNFISLDADARPVALGGAYSSLAGDANALLYNPAGFGALKSHQLTLMHNQYFQGITQEYAAFAYNIGENEQYNQSRYGNGYTGLRQGWGVMLNTLSFGSVQRTTLSNPDGTGLSSFGLRDSVVAFGYGAQILPGFSVGAAVKDFYETVDNASLSAPAADVGILYASSGLPLSFGFAAQNLGPGARSHGVTEPLPMTVRAGAAYFWAPEGLLSLDVVSTRDGSPTVHAGAEYAAFGRLALRAGYDGNNDAGPGITAGLGILFPGASVNYAFAPFGVLGDAHRI
ncbi:MAG: PorV/PorQ family protein, partial [Elusimicrobia bacterium]|nr:PorV/PorQ family protein [Elusimicrobiota bacterium]